MAKSIPRRWFSWIGWHGGRPGPLVTSALNVAEVERNLARKLPQALPLWEDSLQRAGIAVVAARKGMMQGINPKDAAIVAAAVHASATPFVTGDKRLLAEIGRGSIRSLLWRASGRARSMTLQMYAHRKGWALRAVEVAVSGHRDRERYVMRSRVAMEGDLDADQRARLLDSAGRCPVHRTLIGAVEIETVSEG